jgi:hypothetical protein
VRARERHGRRAIEQRAVAELAAWFKPEQRARWSLPSAQRSYQPAPMRTMPLRPDTLTGVLFAMAVPSPSSPSSLFPQQCTLPSLSTAQLWS